MNETLNNIVKTCQNFFVDKELIKSDMMEVALDEDYYEGGFWGVSPLYFKDLVNYKVISKDTLNLIAILKDLDVISASINEFGPGCTVFKHSDADLIQSPHIIRALIPLESLYSYRFSGRYYQEGGPKEGESEFQNEAIIFVPTLDHSFKNLNSHSQFFIIADIASDHSKLTKEFWDNYLYFSISNYVR